MTRPHIEFIQSQALPWGPTPWPGIYAGTDFKILSRDSDTGAMSALVRYPPGWRCDIEGRLSEDEELFVLGGSLNVNGTHYSDRCYAHLPAGYPRQSASSEDGAVVLTFFSGEPKTNAGEPPANGYDQTRLVEGIDTLVTPLSTDFAVLGVAETDGIMKELLSSGYILLREDPYSHEQTWILCAMPRWHGGAEEIHPVVEEMYLVTGDMMAPNGLMMPGAYFWRPPGKRHGPFGSKTGNTMFFRSKGGPLSTEYPTGGVPLSWTPEHRPILPPELAQYGQVPGHETEPF